MLGFIGANDGDGSDNWRYKLCKAPVELLPPTNQHPVYFTVGMPFLSPSQQYKTHNIIALQYRTIYNESVESNKIKYKSTYRVNMCITNLTYRVDLKY